MFSAESTPIMFYSLIVAFSWCSIWSFYELARRQSVSQRVSNALHLVMSGVMLLMVAHPTWAWLTSVVSTPLCATIFGVSTIWFVWLAFAPADNRHAGRTHFLSHAAMFAAMTWHLSAMAAKSGISNDSGGHHQGGGMGGHATADPTMWWFALVGLPLMAYLLVSTLLALWRTVRPIPPNSPTALPSTAHTCAPTPTRPVAVRLGSLAHLAMTGGMFWMSLGLLAPIIPAARMLMI